MGVMDSREERREWDGRRIGHSSINYMQEKFITCGLETRFLGRVNVPMFMDCLSQRPSEAVVSNPRLYNIQIERQYHH